MKAIQSSWLPGDQFQVAMNFKGKVAARDLARDKLKLG
jgi:hypothetical protein